VHSGARRVLLADAPVDALAEQIGVPVVAGGHVLATDQGHRASACKPKPAASGLPASSAGSQLRGFHGLAFRARNCSPKPAIAGVRGVIRGQFMALDVQSSRPKRRSDDGQTILKTALNGWDLRLDLRKLVELRGLEPLASCMP
jgi:hypothetical protein